MTRLRRWPYTFAMVLALLVGAAAVFSSLFLDLPLRDPDGFLGAPFTLHQLRRGHEAVVGEDMHKANFNRRMKDGLRPVKERGETAVSSGLRGRPATLYRRR